MYAVNSQISPPVDLVILDMFGLDYSKGEVIQKGKL